MILSRYNTAPSAIVLDLFCQWAKDNPTADEKDFVKEVLPKFGMKERVKGYNVWGALPKTDLRPGLIFADDGGKLVESYGPVDSANGEYKLSPTNAGKLLSFFSERYNPREVPNVTRPSAFMDHWGLKSIPMSFRTDHALRVLNATFFEIRSYHALSAILSVAGMRVPLFVGSTGASGYVAMAEPESAVWKLEKVSHVAAARPEWKTTKLVPSENWTDAKAYAAGFETGVALPILCDYSAITCFNTRAVWNQLMDIDRFGNLPVKYHAAPTWESGSETREPDKKMAPGSTWKSTFTLPEPVLLMAVRAMLQWARGQRRSCDGVVPVAGMPGVAEFRMPSSPYYEMPDGIYGRWPVRELASFRTDLGDTNHETVQNLIVRSVSMTGSGMTIYQSAYYQNGNQTDKAFFDEQLKRAAAESSLYTAIPCKVTLFTDGGGLSLAPFGSGLVEKDNTPTPFGSASMSDAEALGFAKFRYRVAKAISDNIGTSRRPFQFVSYANPNPAPDAWRVSPDSPLAAIAMIESAMSRFSTYAS